MRLLLLFLLASLAMTACGQKGDLYMAPPEPVANKTDEEPKPSAKQTEVQAPEKQQQ